MPGPTRFRDGIAVGRYTDDPTSLTNIGRVWAGTASVDFGSATTGAEVTATITVTGSLSANANVCFAQFVDDVTDGLVITSADVTSDNTLTVTCLNTTAGTVDEAARDLNYLVIETT